LTAHPAIGVAGTVSDEEAVWSDQDDIDVEYGATSFLESEGLINPSVVSSEPPLCVPGVAPVLNEVVERAEADLNVGLVHDT
jgi:hypothetical protein